jgi:uncharacterized protein involved in response to NO
MPLIWLAGAAWIFAFGGFALLYGPTLCQNRPVWEKRAAP